MSNFSVLQGNSLKDGDNIYIHNIEYTGGVYTQTFLNLSDTPSTYDYGKVAMSTTSGIVWSTVSGVSSSMQVHGNEYHGEDFATEGDLLLHMSDTDNPHEVSETDILPSQTGNNGKFLTTNGVSTAWAAVGAGGTSDHGELIGLSDDDHTQYHTDARGDARYYTQSQVDGLVASASGISYHDNTYHTEEYVTISELTSTSGVLNDKISVIAGVENLRAGEEGTVSIGAGVSEVSVTLVTAQADADYVPSFSIVNTLDNNPSEYAATITEKTTTGFVISLSGPTDTSNYRLAYQVGSSFTEYDMVGDTSPQLGGDLELNGHNIDFGTVLTDNSTYTGDIITVTVDDASTVFGSVLYQAADFHFERADADATTTSPVFALALEAGTGSKKVLLRGQVCNTAWNWSAGKVYLSTTTGGITQTRPSGSGDQVQVLGWALSADTLFFDPVTLVVEVA